MLDARDFKQAMRQCAGGVALVTVGAEHGKRTGLTVTSACSLSDNPPSLIVCVNRNASAHARIRAERAFAINFLHEDHALLALTFSGQKGIDGDDRFTFGQWTRGVTGAPVLSDAVAAFDCILAQEFETMTHSIFVGEVRCVSHSDRAAPLVYLRSSFHVPREIRGTVTVGDRDSRHLSWSDFS
jgi:cob(II)yrinic acid a,c-diamide reductase